MVAGHSLGEFSALVANGVLVFEDGLKLVSRKSLSHARRLVISIQVLWLQFLGLEDAKVEEICASIDGDRGSCKLQLSGTIGDFWRNQQR